MLRNAIGVGVSNFQKNNIMKTVWFNVVGVSRGGGVKFLGKKRYLSLEWPFLLSSCPKIENCRGITCGQDVDVRGLDGQK